MDNMRPRGVQRATESNVARAVLGISKRGKHTREMSGVTLPGLKNAVIVRKVNRKQDSLA